MDKVRVRDMDKVNKVMFTVNKVMAMDMDKVRVMEEFIKMNLIFAVICLDCDEIFNTKEFTVCPNCGSRNNAPLSRWFPAISAVKGQLNSTQKKGGEVK